MTKHVVAIDVGTQSTRAAVVSADGAIVGVSQIGHAMDSPRPGWAQQQPDAWWREACEALQTVLRQTAVELGSISGVCTCGQMHGPVGVDEGGAVTTPWVQLWCDKRAEEQCEEIRTLQDASELHARAGNPVVPAWTGIKVRWLKDHDPRAYGRTRWFLVPKDFINFRLTGIAAADPSEASCSYLWDWRTEDYSPALAAAVGVDLEKFAPVRPSQEVIGSVTAAAARLTGIPAGTPVVAGGGDFPVSMLGFGIVGEGVTADVTGTSTLLAAHTKTPLLDPSIQNVRHVVKGWIPFTILDCGGISMKWFKDMATSLRGADVSYEELIEMAAAVPPGSEGLVFLPYMMGERRRENTRARGGYLGITLSHSGGHLVRAVMEGVALNIGKDIRCFEAQGHRLKRLMSVGGGTRNELWNEIKANVTASRLELSEEPEAGLRGAALLGSAGVGLIRDLEGAALERQHRRRIVEPHPAAVAAYRPLQEEYIRTYAHMLGFWQRRTGD